MFFITQDLPPEVEQQHLDIVEKLDGYYHHSIHHFTKLLTRDISALNFETSPASENFRWNFNNSYEIHPGFWYSVDKDEKILRCGCTRNIRDIIKKFEKIENESYIYAALSYRSDKLGFSSMKNYKQAFRKKWKILSK